MGIRFFAKRRGSRVGRAWNRPAAGPATMQSLEQRQMLTAVTIDGTAAAETWLVRLHPDTVNYPNVTQIFANATGSGTPLHQLPRWTMDSLVITGNDGDDQLIVDATYGVPFKTDVLVFNGKSGVDKIELIGQSSMVGYFYPDATSKGNGRATIAGTDFAFTSTNSVTAHELDSLLYYTPNDHDDLTADTLVAQQRGRINGTSDVTELTTLVFYNTTKLVLDVGFNSASCEDFDFVTFSNGMTVPGLDRVKLKQSSHGASVTITGGAVSFYHTPEVTTDVEIKVNSGGVLNWVGFQPTDWLIIDDGGRVNLPAGTNSVLPLGAMRISGSGQLNIRNNDVLIDCGIGEVPTQALVTSGYAGGTWNGPGIMSDSVADNYAIGCVSTWRPEMAYLNGSFRGYPLYNESILIRYLPKGDKDLNGVVDSADSMSWAQYYTGELVNPNMPPAWIYGDWDYDCDNDLADMAGWIANFSGDLDLQPDFTVGNGGPAAQGTPWTLNMSWVDTCLSWSVHWGDGTFTSVNGNLNSATHTYASPGSYTVYVAANLAWASWYAGRTTAQIL